MYPARATSEKLLPAPPPATYINKQNGGTTSLIGNYDFPCLCSNKECKRETKIHDRQQDMLLKPFNLINFKLVYTIEFLSQNTIVNLLYS
jgi:hypothetical protein